MRKEVKLILLVSLLMLLTLAAAGCGSKQGEKRPSKTVSITGQVTDDRGAPIADVSVRLGSKGTRTDEQGRFKIEVPSGSYTLQAMTPGYYEHVNQIEVKEEGQQVNIQLSSGEVGDHLADIINTGVQGLRDAGTPLEEVTAAQVLAQPVDETTNVEAAIGTEIGILGDKLGIAFPEGAEAQHQFLQQFVAAILQKLKQGRSCDSALVGEVLHNITAGHEDS